MKKFFLSVITVLGIALLFWVGRLLVESHNALQWPQTKGHVLSSLLTIEHLPKFIDQRDDPARWYGADVQYEYSVGGRTYISNRATIKDGGVRSPISALKLMNKYRHQHEVTVYYNPANPEQAVLEPENIGDIFIPLMLGGLFTFVGLMFFYEQSLEIKARGVDNHLQWGKTYQKQGKFDQALVEFNKIIEASPNLSQGYKSRGGLYLQLGKWDQSIADYSRAIGIDPIDAANYFNRANAYLGNKQYDKAWEGMLKAMEMGYKVKPKILEEIKCKRQ